MHEARKRMQEISRDWRSPGAQALRAEAIAKRLSSAVMCSRDFLTLLRPEGGAPIFIPFSCGKKWCPLCVVTWSRDLRERTLAAAKDLPPREVRHLVLTVPNARLGRLADRVQELIHAFREWRNQGRRAGWWRPAGYAAKLEVDFTGRARMRRNRVTGRCWLQRPGWHPHLHIILHVPDGFDFRRGSPAMGAWCRITATAGAPALPWGQHITAARDGAAVVAEVAKYAAKPLQLAHLPPHNIAEVAEALHRVRFVSAGGTLRLAGHERHERDLVQAGRLSLLVEAAQRGDEGAVALVRAFAKQYGDDPTVRQLIPREVFIL